MAMRTSLISPGTRNSGIATTRRASWHVATSRHSHKERRKVAVRNCVTVEGRAPSLVRAFTLKLIASQAYVPFTQHARARV